MMSDSVVRIYFQMFPKIFECPALTLICLDPAGERTSAVLHGEMPWYKSTASLNQVLEEREDIEVLLNRRGRN